KGADINAKDEEDCTPLHLAAGKGYADIVNFLIEKGADINAKDEEDWTPLHLATKNGHIETVKALLEKGAKVDAVDKNGWTSLYLAAWYGHTDIVEFLIAHNASVNAVDKNGRTPLFMAIINDNKEMVKALLEKGADPLAEKTSFGLLKYLVELIKDNKCKHSRKAEETQQEEEPEGNEYEFLKYSLLFRNNCSLIDMVEVGTLNSLVCTWFADVSNLTPNQEKLNKELLSFLCSDGCFTKLEKFLQNNLWNEDLEYILNLRRGESKSTILHILSSINALPVENYMDILGIAAKSDIEDDRGKTPLDVAIDNRNYDVEELLLTEEQRDLKDELRRALQDLGKLRKFLNEHEDNRDLKRVLNLHNSERELAILQSAEYIYSDKASYEKAKDLLLEAGANDCKELDRKEHSPKLGTLWGGLIPNQQEKLETSLDEVDKAQSMDELAQVVNRAIESRVRINFPKQGKLYGKAYENQYGFTDYVIKKISDLKKKHKTEKDIEVASGIVCKLVSQGAVLHNINSMCVIDELEEFKDHKANMKQACLDHQKCTLKFMEFVKSAASGRLKDAKMDASTFYLRYSKDSTVHPAKITDGARDLGLIHGETGYGRNIIKIGKSEVEIITENGIRNYTNLADGSNIILTFYTTQGELDVRLYTDEKNKDLIKVEVQDQDKWKKLKDCNEEIGKNCLLGGLSVNQAIEQGSFTKHGELMRSEAMRPSKEVPETAVDNVSTTKVQQEVRSQG
ncbi:MAG: ankyrin repeat domain-containing protein, partial [Wolbachia sp.]